MSTTRPRVLVVDDKENMLKLLGRILGERYDLTTASDGAAALERLARERFDVVLTDIRMPGADGFEVLRAARATTAPPPEVILMTAYGTVQDAVEAMRLGAYDYLQKPFDPDDAALVVARAAERKGSVPVEEAPAAFEGVVGQSAPLRDVQRLLEQAATIDITVLLLGETGTGKELAARALHARSPRSAKAFVPVNCGALPPELVESELFGHARGAFTGAVGARPGLFAEAEGGTIFLDEIGELPLPMQVKLNRALQEKEIRRVGDSTPTKVDVRVIAATHRDLREEVGAGRFREDLFYRLNVFPVRLPPLRERAGDVPLLATHFLAKHARAFRRALTGFEPEALTALERYAWPGNVRELENAIERATALATGPLVAVRDLPPELTAAAPVAPAAGALARLPYREAVELARERASRDYLVALLQEFGGNVTRAAERAGMERESLHRLLKRYGVRSEEFKR
jgi:DNA-binding NtrC family response regulator